jgi:hypothetical protein
MGVTAVSRRWPGALMQPVATPRARREPDRFRGVQNQSSKLDRFRDGAGGYGLAPLNPTFMGRRQGLTMCDLLEHIRSGDWSWAKAEAIHGRKRAGITFKLDHCGCRHHRYRHGWLGNSKSTYD